MDIDLALTAMLALHEQHTSLERLGYFGWKLDEIASEITDLEEAFCLCLLE